MNSLFTQPLTRLIPLVVLFSALTTLSSVFAAEPTPKPTTSHHFRGMITAVDATSLTVTKKKTNESQTFQLSSETTVSKADHSQGSLSDLHVGQHVKVKSTDGSKASHVFIQKDKHAEKNEEGGYEHPSASPSSR